MDQKKCPCGKTIENIKPSRFERTKYCSKKCLYQFRPKTGFKKGHKSFKGSEKGWFTTHRGKRYGLLVKEYWKKEEYREKQIQARKGVRVSIATEFKSEDCKGDKHWNWKGGIATSRINDFRLKNWRKSVFERDDFTCQDCGVRGGELNAHHIKSWAEYPELRFCIDNGQTLCRKCHYKTASYGNKKIKKALV